MRRIGIIAKRNSPEAIALAGALAEWLRPKGIEVTFEKEVGEVFSPPVSGPFLNLVDRKELSKRVEMIIVLGEMELSSVLPGRSWVSIFPFLGSTWEGLVF